MWSKYCLLLSLLLSFEEHHVLILGEVALDQFLTNQTILLPRQLRSSITAQASEYCNDAAISSGKYKNYFDGMQDIYAGTSSIGSCLPVHRKCGWPKVTKTQGTMDLPLYVISIGLEGAGHHLWTDILDDPLFDCIWKNARHYHRDIGDGVPRTSTKKLSDGIKEQFQLRSESGQPTCKRIYDSEDSFPTGSIRKTGRIFCRPDLINIQKLDGILFHAKYLIIARNVTVSF